MAEENKAPKTWAELQGQYAREEDPTDADGGFMAYAPGTPAREGSRNFIQCLQVEAENTNTVFLCAGDEEGQGETLRRLRRYEYAIKVNIQEAHQILIKAKNLKGNQFLMGPQEVTLWLYQMKEHILQGSEETDGEARGEYKVEKGGKLLREQTPEEPVWSDPQEESTSFADRAMAEMIAQKTGGDVIYNDYRGANIYHAEGSGEAKIVQGDGSTTTQTDGPRETTWQKIWKWIKTILPLVRML